MEMILLLVIMVGGLFLMNSFSRRSQKKRQDERERMMNEEMIPGVWVQTFSGFFGRFVDIDGDVVILETPSGEETYWVKAAIRGVTEPPFEAVQDLEDLSEDDDVEDDSEETAIYIEGDTEVSSNDEIALEEFEAQFPLSDPDNSTEKNDK